MSLNDELAVRLRQSIQGCTTHSHGPIQTWAAIEEASFTGSVQVEEIARLAIAACIQRIGELERAGVAGTDQRVKKEELTRAFIERLLL
jgi:hypothetical protein